MGECECESICDHQKQLQLKIVHSAILNSGVYPSELKAAWENDQFVYFKF